MLGACRRIAEMVCTVQALRSALAALGVLWRLLGGGASSRCSLLGSERRQPSLLFSHGPRSRRSIRKGSAGAAAHRHVTAFCLTCAEAQVSVAPRAVVIKSRLASQLHSRKPGESGAVGVLSPTRCPWRSHSTRARTPSYLHCRSVAACDGHVFSLPACLLGDAHLKTPRLRPASPPCRPQVRRTATSTHSTPTTPCNTGTRTLALLSLLTPSLTLPPTLPTSSTTSSTPPSPTTPLLPTPTQHLTICRHRVHSQVVYQMDMST